MVGMTLLGPAGPRLRTVLVGLLAAQAVLVVVLDRDLALPVTLDVTGDGPRRAVGSLDVGWSVVAGCALAAAALAVTLRLRPGGRADTVERLAATVPWSVVVFVVAVLNGVRDVGALVLVYAATSVVQLGALVQDRVVAGAGAGAAAGARADVGAGAAAGVGVDAVPDAGLVAGGAGRGGWPEARAGSGLLALTVASGIGIVPWGVVALHQVGAGVVGQPPSGVVRVVTLVVLACAIAAFVAEWRAAARSLRERPESGAGPGAGGEPGAGDRAGAGVVAGGRAGGGGPADAGRDSCPRGPRTPAAAVVLLALAVSATAWAAVLGAS